jgi:hypothetical protein
MEGPVNTAFIAGRAGEAILMLRSSASSCSNGIGADLAQIASWRCPTVRRPAQKLPPRTEGTPKHHNNLTASSSSAILLADLCDVAIATE